MEIKIRKAFSNVLSKPHLFFLVISAFFGFIFVILTPPLQGPDEQAHFVQAYKYSDMNFKSDKDSSFPKSIKSTYKTVFYEDDIRFKSTERYEHARTKKALSIPLNQDNREQNDGYLSGTGYSPIGYLPSIIAITISKIINLPVVAMIYFSRLLGLIAWIVIIYFSIKISPIGKWPFVILGILPMSLFQASVISVDTVALAATAFFSAYVFYLLNQNNEISTKDLALLLAIGVIAVLSKQNMIFILPVAYLLMLKTDKLSYKKSRKKLFLAITILLSTIALILIAWTTVGGTANTTTNLPEGTLPSMQIKNFIYHPDEFIYALWNTFFMGWGDDITSSFIGIFGWMDTEMPLSVIMIGYVLLFLGLISNRAEDFKKVPNLISTKAKLFLSLLILGFILSVSAILYAYNTPLNFNIVFGLQGRYFLPVIILLVPLLVNNNQVALKRTASNIFIKLSPVLLLSVSVVYIFIRFFVNTKI